MRDFDDLVKLYQEDPDEFNRECREAIEDFISQLPDDCQTKAKQLQWQLDNELRKYKDPIARMNKMVEMFWETFSEFNMTLQHCMKGEPTPVPRIAQNNTPAKVIPLNQPKSKS